MYESETSIKSGRAKSATRAKGHFLTKDGKRGTSVKAGTLKPVVVIDPNVGLPSIEPHADEPYGVWYTIRKSIRGFWATRETEDTTTNKELYIRTTLRELFVYMLFLITTLVMTFGATNSTMFYLTSALEKQFVDTEEPNFKELNDYKSVFEYLKGPLIEGLYWDHWYNNISVANYSGTSDYIYHANKVLGLPRLRQLRVKNGSCKVPTEFHDIIFDCFGDYSMDQEDMEPFKLKTGLPWTYQTATNTGMASYWGQLATYSGGGYIQDLNRTKSVSEELITYLETNRWLDQGTRAVLVDFTAYNANLNLFATVRLAAEMPPTGGVVTSANIRVIKLIKYLTNLDFVVLAFECIFCFFILYYIGEEFIEISKLKLRYFKSFWNILDISVLTCSVVCIACSVYHFTLVKESLEGLIAEQDEYMDFEYLSYYQITLNNALAVTVFCAWIKVFKYLSFNKTMMQLSSTLGRAAKDVASFAIMFFIVFFAFAQLGFFLFGTQLNEYSDVGTASFTLLRIILGDFDFDSLQNASRFFGPFFFFLYIFFVFFVLLNMFLAIINETYSTVKEDLSHKRNDFEMTDYVKKGFRRLVRAFHIKRFERKRKGKNSLAVDAQILKHKALVELGRWEDDLKSRGYTMGEIEEVFGKGIQAEKDETAVVAKEPHGNMSAMDGRIKKLEAALAAILTNFDQALAKLDVMERAKLTREKKLDAIIDNLDGGEFHKGELKQELAQRHIRIPATSVKEPKKP